MAKSSAGFRFALGEDRHLVTSTHLPEATKLDSGGLVLKRGIKGAPMKNSQVALSCSHLGDGDSDRVLTPVEAPPVELPTNYPLRSGH